MSPELIGIIGIAALLVLLFLGVYISITMALVGFVGTLILVGPLAAFTNLYVVPFGLLKEFDFVAMPLFILMSDIISFVGIGTDAFNVARAWIGQIRGGLAMASVGACGLFAATSGSSMACVAVMGKVAYPEMVRFKYSAKLAVGCLAAGGSVGVMIPPSLPFITYGILTETSIGKLFIAGIIPGITQVIFYFIAIYIMCRLNPSLGPASPNLKFKEKITSSASVWPIALLFIIVIGGIYMGVFTPTESGAIGALGAFLIGLSRRKVNASGLWTTLNGTVKVSGMILLLLTTAFILNGFMALSRVPFVAGQYIASLGINKYLVLGIILVVYIILGMFFDMMAIMVLTIPILFPVMMSLGFNPIWYGVIMTRMTEMGFITPPYGINLFILTGTVRVPLETSYKGIMPFIITDLVHVAFLVVFPQLSTFLPSIMK